MQPEHLRSDQSISEELARRIAADCFGIDAEVDTAEGFADQTFLLHPHSGGRLILKIARPGSSRPVLEMQDALLDFLSRQHLPFAVPEPRKCPGGSGVSEWSQDDGGRRLVRVLSYIEGTFACDLGPADAPLLRSVGRGLGELDKALTRFTHGGAMRSHEWDLARADEICRGAPLDEDLAGLVERCLGEFSQHTKGALRGLRHSVIHGDVNDHNLLVAERPGRGTAMTGLIDFGDALHAAAVCDLAIALAYFMMDQDRPLLAAQEIVAAYHSRLPVAEAELEVLFDLVRVRLCMSLCHSARARIARPGNAYLTRSERAARALLERLGEIDRLFATAMFRDACGITPWPAGAALALRLASAETAPVVQGIGDAPRILDFTPRSDDLGGAIAPESLARFSALIDERLQAAATAIGLGRYGEIRALYQSAVFADEKDGGEPRTVHLGVDVFAPAGTPVYAPLDGIVHSFADNARPLDYGPTIVLEHELPGLDRPFYTLYGHLSLDSLAGLETGARIRAGAEIARMGGPEVNGGWPPHLHFQVIGDMLGQAGDFPGVARHSEINVWKSLCPNPARFVGLDERLLDGDCGSDPVALARRRDCCLAPSLSLSFRQPVKVIRGRGACLYTEQGREILDLVNNVAHVGHAHPHVVDAIRRQEAELNTNTRYLHDGLVTYAERLTALMPAPLDTCFLVCSGSEANDLALRLARAFTGGGDVVVVDGAYHGNLGALVEISPYKFNGRGGAGRPPHVQVAEMPDVYNGRFAGDPDASAAYADSVGAAFSRIAAAGHKPAAFVCESALGCGGQIILPDGYLDRAYELARAADAVCVADEVQVGFGRLGRHMWGFEHQGVVPDIVTLGKPIGNGYPLAAVVTTRAMAEAFANGMEYFNTFGGNPVACAAGHAVLDVIQKQDLLQHAARLGAEWLELLRARLAGLPGVGDVRGMGLFIGVELVRDGDSREPDSEGASRVVELMKRRDIQIGVDGPRYNVLKIKPPMVITGEQARQVVEALGLALEELT